MDNNSLLGSVRRRWLIVVILALAGAVAGAIPQQQQVEQQLTRYNATHIMLQNELASHQAALISPSQIALFASAGEVPLRAAERLGFDGNPAELAAQISVEYDFATGSLMIGATQDSARLAERYADTYADVLSVYLVERQDLVYQDRLAAFLDRLDVLEEQLNDLTRQIVMTPEDPVLEAQRSAVARQYSVAFEQSESLTSSPNILSFSTLQRAQAVPLGSPGLTAPTSRLARALMGGILGVAIGLAISLLLGVFDRRLHTREQVESVLGLRSRVIIPKVRESLHSGLVVLSGRHDPLSDAYRTARNVVGFVLSGLEPVEKARITVVVSAGPGDGKTSMAANLAAAFCELGHRTLVVNTDFRRPTLARSINGVSVTPGPFRVSDLDATDPAWLLRDTPISNLKLLDLAGMGSAGELVLATARLLPRLMQQFDHIVVDTSPVAATAEVLEIVPLADIIVLVARIGHTPISAAQRSIDVLNDTTTAPVVLAISGAPRQRVGYYEYADRRSSPRMLPPKDTWWQRLKHLGSSQLERRAFEQRLGDLRVSDSARLRDATDDIPPDSTGADEEAVVDHDGDGAPDASAEKTATNGADTKSGRVTSKRSR